MTRTCNLRTTSKVRHVIAISISLIMVFLAADVALGQTCVSPAASINSNAQLDAITDQDRAPAIATNEQGLWIAVWVESASISESSLAVSRSTDDGHTWSLKSTLSIPPGVVVSDPDIASDGGDRWIIVFEARGGDGVTVVACYKSTDGGLTWPGLDTIDEEALTDDADPIIEYDPIDSRFLVFWASRNSLGNTIGDDKDILFIRGDANGTNWIFTGALNPDAATDSFEDISPTTASDASGNWVVAWERQTCNQIFCFASVVVSIRSTDEGVSWQNQRLVAADAGGPSIATDRKGVWITAFVQRPSGELDIGFSRSINHGLSWSPTQDLNPNAPYDDALIVVDQSVEIAADEDHNWIAVWESDFIGEGLAGTDREIFVARSYDDGLNWIDQAYANSTAGTDGSAVDAEPTIAVDYLRGRWVILWESQANVGGIGADYDILATTITAPSFYVDTFTDCSSFCFGTSWQFAYDDLDAALDAAANAGGGIIRVANGTYTPDSAGLMDPRDATFSLPACTRIMGGYAGDNAIDPDLRDVVAQPTVLSGDIGTSSTADDCYTVVTGNSGSIESVLSGLTITRGNANDGNRPGGLYQSGGSLVLEQVNIINNLSVGRIDNLLLENVPKLYLRELVMGTDMSGGFAGKIVSSNKVYISGLMELDSSLQLYDTGIVNGEPLLSDAPGSIHLAPDSRFAINALDESIIDPSQSSARLDRITGSGTVELSAGQGFVFTGEIDLQGAAPPAATCDDPAATAQWGELKVLGELLLDDALIEHARIINFDDSETPADCGNYSGGKILSLSASEIRDCAIVVRGDRYFEFNPDEAPSVFTDSCLTVQSILPASFGEQGRLFEARSEDVTFVPDPMNPDAYPSGAFQLPPNDPGFNSIWTIDTLEVLNNGRVDIVNEEDYTMSPYPEAVYVRDLVLGDDAILNTGFQRVYYETLSMGTGAQIVDIPLLGFSLGVIDFENECDYNLRVDRNNNVSRITIDDGFAMQMQAFEFGDAVAKGTFARAEGDSVLVAFNYRYTCLPVVPEFLFFNVYLSDTPGVYQGQTVHIATITPPPDGRPGSITSDEFATFFGVFPRGDLDFTRGTYVELRMSAIIFGFDFGCVEIDNFDPAVQCTSTCRDLTGDNTYTNKDVLYQLAEIGQATSGENYCLDHPFSSDIYGDQYDLLFVDGLQGRLGNLSSCGLDLGMSPVAPQAPTLPGGSLIVAGKLATGPQDDVLLPINLDNTPAGPLQSAASRPGPAGVRGNHRIITDGDGELYQLNVVDGLIRLSDAAVILGPEMPMVTVDGAPATVFINPVPGAGESFDGGALFDAAFDPNDPNVVYVGPVYVDVDDPAIECPYRSVARVDLSGATPAVTHLYGESPQAAGGQPALGFNCDTFIFNPDFTHIREIEVDNDGHLLVAASNSLNDNQWLRIWDTASGMELHQIELGNLSAPIEAPTAMTWVPSSDGGTIFFGTALTTPGATDTQVVRYELNVESPAPLANPTVYTIGEMQFVSSLVALPSTRDIVAIGYIRPFLPDGTEFDDNSGIFTSPRIAILPDQAGVVTAQALNANGLALPLGAGFAPAADCLAGDTNEDGAVTVADIPSFAEYVLMPPSAPEQRVRMDLNVDNAIDGRDLAEFVQLLLSGGC